MDGDLEQLVTGGAVEADAVSCTAVIVQNIEQINAHLTNLETIGIFILIAVGFCFGAVLTNVMVKLWKV